MNLKDIKNYLVKLVKRRYKTAYIKIVLERLDLTHFYNEINNIFILYPKPIYYKNFYIDLDYFYKVPVRNKDDLLTIKFLIYENYNNYIINKFII